MTTEEALRKWGEIMATRPAPVREEPAPALDQMRELRKAMTTVQGILCDMGAKDRMSITIGQITDLLRMCNM